MPHVKLTKRFPFTLALLYSIVFVTAYLLAAATAFHFIDRSLASRLDRLVYEKYSSISVENVKGDTASLIASVNSQIRITTNEKHVFLLRSTTGETLAGNASLHENGGGYTTKSGATLGLSDKANFRVLGGRVDDMELWVGINDDESQQIKDIVVDSFGFASLAALIVTLGGATWLANRSQHRLDSITESMQAVSQGRLNVRLPESSRQDDIDYISSAVNATLDELQSMITALDTVSSNIAHDLKSPINRLFVDIENAKVKAEKHENVAAELEKATHEIFVINKTIDALLRIAKIEHSAQTENFALLELTEFVNSMVEIYAPVFEEQSKSLNYTSTSHQNIFINADSGLLTQVFVNVLENSLRYCIAAGSRVDVVVRESNGHAVVTISDDGPGIPDNEKSKVFDRLYRIEKSRTLPGLGLGLSLVRAIIKLHASTITLSDNHPGLIVTLTFPLVDSNGQTHP